MAESVLNTGFATLKCLLRNKCQQAGIYLVEISKNHNTWAALLRKVAIITAILVLPAPKALGMKTWSYSAYNIMRDHDFNAASNILATWHCRLAVGILFL